MLKIMFDDNDDMKTFKAPYTTVSTIQQGVYSATLYDEVDFAETASHKFSFHHPRPGCQHQQQLQPAVRLHQIYSY